MMYGKRNQNGTCGDRGAFSEDANTEILRQ